MVPEPLVRCDPILNMLDGRLWVYKYSLIPFPNDKNSDISVKLEHYSIPMRLLCESRRFWLRHVLPEVRIPIVDDVSHISHLRYLFCEWTFRFSVQDGDKFSCRIQAEVKGTGFASKDNIELARLPP